MNTTTSGSPMGTGLKRFFGLELATLLSEKIAAAQPSFPSGLFLQEVAASDLFERELLSRVNLLAELLHQYLPRPYPAALDVLVRIYGAENPHETGMFTYGYWLWPVGSFIARYGLDHPERSIAAIEELTKRHTGEYAIRPYIVLRPQDTVQIMNRWATSSNVHVRRLASEGLRPRLPWSKKLAVFIERPEPVFDVLETLKDDSSRFVQKSVANNLNDYFKENRPAAIYLLRRWAENPTAQRRWIIRHALRNEIKCGAPDATAILDRTFRDFTS